MNRKRGFALAATAVMVFAALYPGGHDRSGIADAGQRRPDDRGIGRDRIDGAVGAGSGRGERQAPAPMDAAGPVRGLLRGRQAGLLQGREPRP